MQKYTELYLHKLKSQLNKEREDDEAKLAVTMAETRLSNPGAYSRNLLEIQDNFIQKFLNAIFDTEKTALFNEQTLVHEDYFDIFKKEVIALVARELDIICSRTLTGSITPHIKQKEGLYRDSVSNRIDILKEEYRLEKSRSLPEKPPEIVQNIKWFRLHGISNLKYIIWGIIVLFLLFALKHCVMKDIKPSESREHNHATHSNA